MLEDGVKKPFSNNKFSEKE